MQEEMGSLLNLALLQTPRYTVEAKSIQALRKLFGEVHSQAMTPSLDTVMPVGAFL
jgi:hypothetical protein